MIVKTQVWVLSAKWSFVQSQQVVDAMGISHSLMPTCADGVDQRESEVKLQVRVDEGSNEATACGIHMNPHVPPVLLVQLSCITGSWLSATHNKARKYSKMLNDSMMQSCMSLAC